MHACKAYHFGTLQSKIACRKLDSNICFPIAETWCHMVFECCLCPVHVIVAVGNVSVLGLISDLLKLQEQRAVCWLPVGPQDIK